MRGVRLELGRPLSPFGDRPASLPVLGRTLAASQERVLAACDVSLADAPPDEPWLALGDHTWLTAPLLRRFLDACPPEGGQLALDGPFHGFSSALQDLPEGRYPVAVVPGGAADLQRLRSLPRVVVDVGEELHEVPFSHPALDAVSEPLPVSLALVSLALEERHRFDDSPWWHKAWAALGMVLRARSVDKWALAGAVAPRGRGCIIHPTATVEASILGDGVEIGPHAVVRASWLGDGVEVGEHARVNLSVACSGAQLGRGLMSNLCLFLEGALVSQGTGFQACVFGRDSFVAMGATAFDLCFGGEIQVLHRGERVSSGSRFLGCAIGHRALVGPHVQIGYGEEVPGGAMLVADPAHIARRIPADLPAGEAHAVVDGELVRVGGRH